MVNKKPKGLYIGILKILIVTLAFWLAPIDTFAVCIYGDGVYGSGVYGGDCPTGGGAGEEGGGAFWSIPLNFTENSTLVNGSCRPKQQIFNGYCYDCDPNNGFLIYTESNKSLICNTCNPGYIVYNNECINAKDFGKTAQSSIFNLSFFILILVILLAYYWNQNRIRKRRVVEADNEDEDNE